MSAWPEKKELKVHGHQYCHECKNVGWNEAQKECSKAAMEMILDLRINIPDYLSVNIVHFKMLSDHNAKINALIEMIRGKM